MTFLNHDKMGYDITEITPHLYVCGKRELEDDAIKRLGITLIVNAAEELDNYKPQNDVSCEELKNIICVKIPARDGAYRLFPYFKKTAELIKANQIAGGKTIVHCIAGISRSVSLCAAYLMMYGNKRALEAIEYIQERRRLANPNPFFRSQLKEFENELVNSGHDCCKSEEKDISDDERTTFNCSNFNMKVLISMDKIIKELRMKNFVE